ncbi:MAG: hypothetical protein KDC70_00055 [Saprospiraceae bacterium]|nr:hypothetical protein [Saprospiraceae bacterium]
MTTRIWIQKGPQRLAPDSRDVLIETIKNLPEGGYNVTFEAKKQGYTTTRYRYYFGCIVQTILLTCADRFKIVQSDGEMRAPTNTEEMHEILKFYYNPVTIVTPQGAFTTGSTTTALNDRDFIGEYMESILADFSLPPYNCDFMQYDDWREMMKSQHA